MFGALSTFEQYLNTAIGLAAEMAEKAGKKPSSLKVAMAFENDPFSLDVRAGVLEDAKKYGMKIVIDDKLPRDLSDMSATLRSEEHTSELQSLMRISYAVFCLKKKQTTQTTQKTSLQIDIETK